jgi:alginate O-acetyltransferase complex protein AlgJ
MSRLDLFSPSRREARRGQLNRGATESDVRFLYTALLGRQCLPEEASHHVRTSESLAALIETIVQSDEFAVRHETRPAPSHDARVNIWHPELEPYTHASGTTSADGIAQVGSSGWLYLIGGSNAVRAQYDGSFNLPVTWLEDWAASWSLRLEQASALGARLCGLIVPDKLAVLADQGPGDFQRLGEPPAARLAADPRLDRIVYPVAELSAVGAHAYLRTDTHLAVAGYQLLANILLDCLGVGGEVPLSPPTSSYLTSGDLGSRFEPKILEVVRACDGFGAAEVVEDNYQQVSDVGGHIGIRRVLRNPTAADDRAMVVFGDSYAFPAGHHPGVAWQLAQAFREVHFLWLPFGWDGDYVARVGAELVVCEMAERFAVRPPPPEVDFLQLASRLISSGRPIDIDHIVEEAGS